MPLQSLVHQTIDRPKPSGILPDQVRPQFAHPRARAGGVGRQIKRPQRTHLAVPRKPCIGLNGHHRAVKHLHRFAAGPFIAALMQRQIHLIHLDARDLHERKGDTVRSNISQSSNAFRATEFVNEEFSEFDSRCAHPR